MAEITEQALDDMVATIVREVDPKRIVLFGSHARGDAGKDSDVDLIIVEDESFGPKRSRREEIRRIRHALSPFRAPKDILVYSADEVAKWQYATNHIISHSLREGKVVYERP
ncbi:MAG: nucleotidyltransferase domain-containing protein [bacterium]|nr:nucleotidyltransferase domain-containing protein [bacterium]